MATRFEFIQKYAAELQKLTGLSGFLLDAALGGLGLDPETAYVRNPDADPVELARSVPSKLPQELKRGLLAQAKATGNKQAVDALTGPLAEPAPPPPAFPLEPSKPELPIGEKAPTLEERVVAPALPPIASPGQTLFEPVLPESVRAVGQPITSIEQLFEPQPIAQEAIPIIQPLAPFVDKEQAREALLFGQVGAQEQAELAEAAERAQEEYLSGLEEETQRRREALFPSFAESLRRSAGALGAQGLGSAGFGGSGALQELARKGAEQLEREAVLGFELPERAQARQQRAGLFQEALLTPTQFRRPLFERLLEQRDISGERAFERELANLGAQSTIGAARAGSRGSRGGAIGSLLGGLGGFAFGGPAGGLFGSQIGGSIGRIF